MISAFGVEHTVSKSYTQIAGKFTAKSAERGETIGQRARTNWSQWRHHAGVLGQQQAKTMAIYRAQPATSDYMEEGRNIDITGTRAKAKRYKAGYRAMETASNNINRRRKRVLP